MLIPILDNARQEFQELQMAYEGKMSDLDDLRQSLLQRAFAGELT